MVMLCIDDDPMIRSLVKKALLDLADPHDEALEAASAEDALEIVTRRPVDMMIVDLALPGMQGIEFLKRARELRPAVESVVLTGYASLDTAVEAMRCGARDYLAKPLHLGVLKEKICTIRDFVNKRHEIENLSLAKTMVEESAQRSIASFEETMDMIWRCRAEVRQIIDSDNDDATKIARIREILDREEKQWR